MCVAGKVESQSVPESVVRCLYDLLTWRVEGGGEIEMGGARN